MTKPKTISYGFWLDDGTTVTIIPGRKYTQAEITNHIQEKYGCMAPEDDPPGIDEGVE